MKGDFTRNTFRPEKRYSGVRVQQGRVQTDADSNEQADLTAHRIETEARHVIGRCGGPWDDAGFALTPVGAGLEIGGGFYYVDGILCWNPAAVSITGQPDLPGELPGQAPVVRDGSSWVPLDQASPGYYLAWLDVWSRHLTALDDPEIREVALGGPDTATRTKTIWQVRLYRIGDNPTSCAGSFPGWDALTAPSTGRLNARAEPDPTSTEPCAVAPGAGYRRLENQLYRVEIHQGGDLGAATFKWSRENGSIVTGWEKKENDNLTVASPGRDPGLGFAAGQWIELTDANRDLRGEPGTLVQLKSARDRVLEIDPATRIGPSVELADYKSQPRVRRWESQGVIATADTWIPLEDGVEVRFSPGTYRTGDYWWIPARTATGRVEWPEQAGNPLPQLAHGIHHHHCRLAIVQKPSRAPWTVVSDCRNLFPPLNSLVSFFYRGGAGQEVNPDPLASGELLPLPEKLQVGVTLGPYPWNKRQVRFTVTKGSGQVNGATSVVVLTGSPFPDGVAGVDWSLDGSTPSQEVKAELLSLTEPPVPVHTPIFFHASLSEASRVSYDPKDCSHLQAAQVRTVQEAITELCKRNHGGCEVVVGPGGQYPTIETAVAALLAEGEHGEGSDICLCLLPGPHSLSASLTLTSPQPAIKRLNVSIHACHPGAVILGGVYSLTFLDLASVAFENVRFFFGDIPEAIRVEKCDDVAVTSCQALHWTRAGVLLRIVRAERTRLVANNLESLLFTPIDFNPLPIDFLTELEPLFRTDPAGPSASRIAAAADRLASRPKTERATAVRTTRAALKRLGDAVSPKRAEAIQGFLETLAGSEPSRDTMFDQLNVVLWTDAEAAPLPTVVLEDWSGARNTRATLEDNVILGMVCLYGVPAPGSQRLSSDEQSRWDSRELMRLKLPLLTWGSSTTSLWMRGNRLSRMAIGQEMRDRIHDWLMQGPPPAIGGTANPTPVDLSGALHTLFMNENFVEFGESFWLAQNIRMTGNSFDRVNTDVGWAVSRSAFYTANTAVDDIRLFNAAQRPQANPAALNFLINILFA